MNNTLYNAIMLIALLAFVTLFASWVMSVSGCAAWQQSNAVEMGTDLCIPDSEKEDDPCELEFWENTAYARYCRENENGVGCRE